MFNIIDYEIKCISPSNYIISSKSLIRSSSEKIILEVETIIKKNLELVKCKFEIDSVCKIIDKQYTLKKYYDGIYF